MFARKTSVVVVVAIALFVIKTVTLLILGGSAFLRHTDRDLEYVQTALAVDADQIVPNLARPVSNSDLLGIENVVESMMLDPALKGVVVKSADNQTVLCARERDGQGKVTEARGEIQVEGSAGGEKRGQVRRPDPGHGHAFWHDQTCMGQDGQHGEVDYFKHPVGRYGFVRRRISVAEPLGVQTAAGSRSLRGQVRQW